MNAILPILAGALMGTALGTKSAAQTPLPLTQTSPDATAPAAAVDSNSGDALLRHVLATVDALPSVAAKVRHRVDLLDRPLIGSGTYLQQGRGAARQIRLELALRMTQQAGRWQQICDGKNLWIHEEFDEDQKLGWVDLGRLARARPKAAASPSTPETSWSALGGLPQLLAGIESSFHFGPVSESRLEDLPVYSIDGRWKPARLVQLLSEQKEAIEAGKPVDLSKLAPNLPDRVVVHVGSDDFFPYRIEYWRSGRVQQEAEGGDYGRLILLVEFYEVRLGERIDDGAFAFEPGKLVPTDRTQEFLNKLGLEDNVAAGARPRRAPRR